MAERFRLAAAFLRHVLSALARREEPGSKAHSVILVEGVIDAQRLGSSVGSPLHRALEGRLERAAHTKRSLGFAARDIDVRDEAPVVSGSVTASSSESEHLAVTTRPVASGPSYSPQHGDEPLVRARRQGNIVRPTVPVTVSPTSLHRTIERHRQGLLASTYPPSGLEDRRVGVDLEQRPPLQLDNKALVAR